MDVLASFLRAVGPGARHYTGQLLIVCHLSHSRSRSVERPALQSRADIRLRVEVLTRIGHIAASVMVVSTALTDAWVDGCAQCMSIPAILCNACRLPATGSLARGAVGVIKSIICAAAISTGGKDGGGEGVPVSVQAAPGSVDAGFLASSKRTLTNSDHPHGVELLSSALVRYESRKAIISSDSAMAEKWSGMKLAQVRECAYMRICVLVFCLWVCGF
jgi:hypothetical protein